MAAGSDTAGFFGEASSGVITSESEFCIRLGEEMESMGTLTIRLPDDEHERLRKLAKQRHISLNKLIEE